MTRTHVLVAVTALLATACMRQAREPVREPQCPVPRVDGAGEGDSLRITRCIPTGRARLPLLWKIRTTRCVVGPEEVSGEWREERPLDPRIVLHGPDRPSSESEVVVEPVVNLTKAGGVISPVFDCDAEAGRFYVGSGLLGYVVALDRRGRELWRTELPGFRSIAGELGAQPATAQQLMFMLQEGGSILAKVSSSGAYVAAEYRTADLYHHAIYHRSGALVGVVGPWNGVIEESVEGGWKLVYTESQEPGAYDFPDREITLEVADARIDAFSEHLLASVTPREREGAYEWSLCPGSAADLGDLLGERWKPSFANAALRVRSELGQDWLAKLAQGIGRTSSASMERSLLSAGADVEMMRFATERQLRPWDRPSVVTGSP